MLIESIQLVNIQRHGDMSHHRVKIKHRQTQFLTHARGEGRKIGAFKDYGADVGMLLQALAQDAHYLVSNSVQIKGTVRITVHTTPLGLLVHAVNKHIFAVGDICTGKVLLSQVVTGKVTSGSITFEGEDIVELPEANMRKIRGDKIAMIFQDPMTSLNPVLTVGEQIAEALYVHNDSGRSKEEIEARVDETLTLVGIPPARKHEYPHQFSGGMRQRVVIAIALSCEPDLLIADEPTTALDVTIQAQVLMMIRDLRDRLGTSMIMITHDLGIVAQTCDNVAVMYAGEIIEMGSAEDIFTRPIHHPYTDGLFGSLPNLKEKTDRLHPIAGLMPDPTNLPKGCKFAPRCDKCMEICKEVPPEVYVDGTHSIRCHLYCQKKED